MESLFDNEKSQFHIITCGTSIIGNFINQNPDSILNFNDIESIRPADHQWLEIKNELYSFLKQDSKKFSAEVNSISPFLEVELVERIYLICTDTNAGKMCADILHDFFKEECNISSIDYKEAKGFGTENFEEGILNIRNTLLRLINNHKKKYQICLNATGGFKPESGVLVLIGALYHIPVYYIYETSKKLVFIPPFPLMLITPEYGPVLKQLIDNPGGLRIRKDINQFKRLYGEYLDDLIEIGAIEKKIRNDKTNQYKITATGKFLYEFGKNLR
ncbi:MAG: putative CRISPR-associated protein [Candidatus Lokiarchaeota archaeon]|nr:putative CRISPR-associated protein [Candidatus Lokiarchaeota archaeon]